VIAEEPELSAVQQYFRNRFHQVEDVGMQGLLLADDGNRVMLQTGTFPDEPLFEQVLGVITANDSRTQPFVSEIYQVQGNRSVKFAAKEILRTRQKTIYLIGWSDVTLFPVLQQLTGSIFYIFLGASIITFAIIMLFSRSLIGPIKDLAEYANAIRRDIGTEPVHMDRQDEIGDLHLSLMQMHQEVQDNERLNKQLLAGIAHEIKNPLGGMEIYTGLLNETIPGDGEQKEYIVNIHQSMQQLNQVVSSYLDFARPPKSELREVYIHEVINEIHAILEPELQEKNIRFEMAGKATVQSDESKLRRVFLNMLQNSLHAVPPDIGLIKIIITAARREVIIEVTDNGEGIPEANLDDIFNPYYTTKQKGHGLGLAISKNIIEELDGSIFVDSKEGQGTTFKITLPMK
ncbi:MAG: HAMP domain-containing protein, partial [Candidatus Marinimicrobia bacterium]|nr:HAMP domain-containing protein [Candidatus Neomarinimicrobiota bacterium]